MNENEKTIRVADLFGGIGGFRLGLEKASKRFKTVWYCDKDKYAVQTYNKNFKEQWKPTDITKVSETDIPDFDLLCAGFPCQSFSIAGKRLGFGDTRGTLFFEIARILQQKQPPLVLLENVKGLLSHDEGKTFETIINTMDEIGFSIEWQVHNSKYFGVPQNRERVFIIGHLRTKRLCGREVFPLRQGYQELGVCDEQGRWDASETKPASAVTTREGQRYENNFVMLHNVYGGVHSLQPRSPDRPSLKYSSGGSGHLQRTDGYSYCLDSGNCQARELGKSQIRRLTPIECERLQGFPDDWTSGVSDTQRYKQLGNAVTVNVVQAIGAKLLEVLK
jgi:DNA (cytosine-5)-methyltransferase 1